MFSGAYAQAELLGQALRQASARPGGLTRTNLLLSLWTLDVEHPTMPGVRVHTNGAADPFAAEGGVLVVQDGEALTPRSAADADGLTSACQGSELGTC
ncbi:MAG: hypothetical protein ACKVWR_00640 [Acidimicrobiales bacterium]